MINTNCMVRKVKRIFLHDDGRIEEKEVEVHELSLQEYNLLQIEWIKGHQYFLGKEYNREVSFNEACYSWINKGYAEQFRLQFLIRKDNEL